ncbi:helix-turn-helix domain-containing protein [Nocardioides sp. JQ2195]|uniref:IclR family transcriptional regulator n=1 Tax=Nocardioides sp. JQ2195 TaxID=2592334 RepID=UPI001F1075E0|nr:helix-turn-helix domain-containing protein [Nocardioides sp. JQ2195]
MRPRHRMVDRVAGILETVARSENGLSLTEIARQVDAPLSTCQGLVNGLVATGYLDEKARSYRLGVAPYLLNLLAGRGAVNRVDHQDLVDLHAETGMTAIITVAVGQDQVYIDHCSTDPSTAYLAESYMRRSLIRTSSGWILLADYEQRDLWAYLQGLPDVDAGRVESLLEHLPEIRRSGICAIPHVAENPDSDGISVALREGNRTVAAVGVVGPHAILAQRRDEIVETLQRHAARWHQRD